MTRSGSPFSQYRIDRVQVMVQLAFAHRPGLAVEFDDQAILPGAQHRAVAFDMLQGQIVDGFQFQRMPVQPLHFDVFVIGNFEVFQDLMQATTKPKAAHRVQSHAKHQHRA